MWICRRVQLTNCTSVTGSNSLSLSALNTFSTFKEEHLTKQKLKWLQLLWNSYLFFFILFQNITFWYLRETTTPCANHRVRNSPFPKQQMIGQTTQLGSTPHTPFEPWCGILVLSLSILDGCNPQMTYYKRLKRQQYPHHKIKVNQNSLLNTKKHLHFFMSPSINYEEGWRRQGQWL